MYKEKVMKSQLLKNIPIDTINQYRGKHSEAEEVPITVYERDGNYFVLEGIENLLNTNGSGDGLVDCYVTHRDSFL